MSDSRPCRKCGGTQYRYYQFSNGMGPSYWSCDNPSCPSNRERYGYNEQQNSDGTGHHTWYDKKSNRRMSWDSNSDGTYKPGTGHEKDQNHPNRKPKKWD